MTRRTHKESLKFEQALAYEMKHLMRKLDIEELTAAEMAEIELKASDRAEAAFDNWLTKVLTSVKSARRLEMTSDSHYPYLSLSPVRWLRQAISQRGLLRRGCAYAWAIN